jgi:hypothetical protein
MEAFLSVSVTTPTSRLHADDDVVDDDRSLFFEATHIQYETVTEFDMPCGSDVTAAKVNI